MRIVSVMTSSTRGGAEYAAVRLLDAVAARGHEAVLLTSHPDTAQGTRVAARHIDLGPKLGSRSWPRLALQWPLLHRRLRRELEREAPFDVLLLHFKKEQLLAPRLPAQLRPRLAWAEWGPVPPPMRGGPPGRLYRRAAHGVDAVLAVSDGTRESLIAAGVPAERVGVVPNAIDPERFRPLPEEGAAHRRRLGIPADAFLIGCLTRFNARKRNDVAIDAAVRLAAQPGREVHLLMLGEGDTEAELRTRAAPLGDAAHFVPTTGAEPAELLSGCDVVVFCPSPTEGEPLAISMGMLTERPVVATAAEGATGLIQPGTGAIATPDHDAAAVAALLASYRADPRLVVSEGGAARALAASRHDPGAVAERAEALLFGGPAGPGRKQQH
jgi:glycosyltransferase involved in cell wall biosynthesis